LHPRPDRLRRRPLRACRSFLRVRARLQSLEQVQFTIKACVDNCLPSFAGGFDLDRRNTARFEPGPFQNPPTSAPLPAGGSAAIIDEARRADPLSFGDA
jgi:hypothetical protein